MDPLAPKIAARYIAASLEHEFVQRFEKLLAYAPNNPPPEEIKAFRKWISEKFHFTRTPKGLKREREELERLWRGLEHTESRFIMPGVFHFMYGDDRWTAIKRMIPAWVAGFTSEEGSAKAITHEKTVGGNTYTNLIGASDARLNGLIDTIESAFHGLKGWRRKALDGGINVMFLGSKDFHGTVSGKYKTDKDQLWIRATPGGRIDKGGTGYAGLAYVITHELGHRYEHKQRVPSNVEGNGWYTSPYSLKEGEAFAELFALSNFDIRGTWGDTLDRFERIMTKHSEAA